MSLGRVLVRHCRRAVRLSMIALAMLLRCLRVMSRRFCVVLRCFFVRLLCHGSVLVETSSTYSDSTSPLPRFLALQAHRYNTKQNFNS